MSDREDATGRVGLPMFGSEVMISMTKASLEAMSDWNKEIHRFMSHRLEQDMSLQEAFSRCRSPGEYFQAYATFMTKAMHDYVEEVQLLQEMALEAASSSQQAATAGLKDPPL